MAGLVLGSALRTGLLIDTAVYEWGLTSLVMGIRLKRLCRIRLACGCPLTEHWKVDITSAFLPNSVHENGTVYTRMGE
jgi:hypothetical protein